MEWGDPCAHRALMRIWEDFDVKALCTAGSFDGAWRGLGGGGEGCVLLCLQPLRTRREGSSKHNESSLCTLAAPAWILTLKVGGGKSFSCGSGSCLMSSSLFSSFLLFLFK